MLCPVFLIAQNRYPGKVSIELQSFLRQAPPSQKVNLILRGNASQIDNLVQKEGGTVKLHTGTITSVEISASKIPEIASSPDVKYIEFSLSKGTPLNDIMLVNNNVLPVHQGVAPLDTSYWGQGVVMGFIDTGIELQHPDFQNPDSTTRVKFIWDQTQSGDPSRVPEEYGYGLEWTSEDINNGICTHQDQPNYYGHGSTVTGTGTGNGRAVNNFMGVAPKADIVVVSSDFNHPNWSSTVADGVNYICEKASLLNEPCVINASLGDYMGSHDGLDGPALLIDSILNAAPGRVMVSAAGNSGAMAPYHLGYDVSPTDTSFTWFTYNPNSSLGYGAVFFEIWADTADFNQVQFAIGADKVSPTYSHQGDTPFRYVVQNLNTILVDTIYYNGLQLGKVRTWAGLRGGQYQIQVEVTQPFSSQYRFGFETIGTGHFDSWSASTFGGSDIVTAIPNPGTFPRILNYKLPDTLESIVNSWNCSPDVISVGNYVNRNNYVDVNGDEVNLPDTPGAISVNSSRGPTRQGLQKPDIAASGDNTLSSGKFSQITWLINHEPTKVALGGYHYRNGGTSMASPVVAGIAALYLSRCHLATHNEIADAIRAHGIQDPFTGALPGLQSGYGKVDALAVMSSTYSQVNISPAQVPVMCSGDSILLSATGGFSRYLWSNGDSTATAWIHNNGPITVTAFDASGCPNKSTPVNVQTDPGPSTPIITVQDGQFVSSPGASYQWYFNGYPISDANSQSLPTGEDGDYQVAVFDSLGCSSLSDTLRWISSGLPALSEQAFSVYPNPAHNKIYYKLHFSGKFEVKMFNAQGKTVKSISGNEQSQEGTLSLEGLSSGLYILKIETSSGFIIKRIIVH